MIDEILSIKEVGKRDLIDIEVAGNHLFYANDILTHNSNSDVGLEDTSESFGLPATADFMFALISSEELEKLGQIMVKQLKNRWGSIDHYKRFMVGIDRSKMKLFDAEDSAQDGVMDDRPVMGNTEFGGRQEEEEATVFRPRGRKPNFEGLN